MAQDIIERSPASEGAGSVTLKLPLPPTVNHLFVNKAGKGRFISPGYGQWQWAAFAALQSQKPTGSVCGPFHFRLTVPRGMRGDIDNRLKAAMDFCVAHKITPDDRHAQSVSVERGDVDPGFALVHIEECA
jgi:Holliday junction resolvase RusA-like endonuclease